MCFSNNCIIFDSLTSSDDAVYGRFGFVESAWFVVNSVLSNRRGVLQTRFCRIDVVCGRFGLVESTWCVVRFGLVESTWFVVGSVLSNRRGVW